MELEVQEESLTGTNNTVEAKAQLDASLTGAILAQIDGAGRQEAAIKALLDFTWTQRLYFIVRSALMGILGAAVTGGIVVFMGEVNALQVAVVSVASFVASLAVTRMIDGRITSLSKSIVASLTRHRRLRGIILDHF